MRTPRIRPMLSVMFGLLRQSSPSCPPGFQSCQRRLGHHDTAERIAESRRGPRGARRRRDPRLAPDAGKAIAYPGGAILRELRQRISYDPRPVPVRGLGSTDGLPLAKGRHGLPVDERKRPEGPGEGLLDVGLVVPDQTRDQLQSMLGHRRCAPEAMIDEGHRGHGRANQSALPTRRRIDQLLQLCPAVRLPKDALAAWVGQRVDRYPVRRVARCPAEELPGTLGIVDHEPLEQAKGEPAKLLLRLTEQAIHEEEPGRGAFAPRFFAEATLDRLHQRPTHPKDGPDAGSYPSLSLDVCRVAEIDESRAQAGDECLGIAGHLRQLPPDELSPWSMICDESGRSLADRAGRS